MRKSLTIVLSLVMLLVSCIPCADSQASSSNNSGLAQITKNNGSSRDICPPFCQCNCCAGVSMHILVKCVIPVTTDYAQAYSTLPSFLLLTLAHAVWQPPQLPGIA